MSAKSMMHNVLDWLRSGYPSGVPGPDRVPLLALLRNTPLTDDQIRIIVGEIAEEESHAPEGHQIDHDEIERFIVNHTHHDAGEENIRRVAAILAAAGWPLAGLTVDQPVGVDGPLAFAPQPAAESEPDSTA